MLAVPFEERNCILQLLLGERPPAGVRRVPTQHVPLDFADTYHAAAIADGYEGTMIRLDTAAPYESGKRSTTLLKRKESMQEEFECLDMTPQKHCSSERLGSVRLRNAAGVEFNARPAMSDADKAEIWEHKEEYTGKVATVTFFAYTDGGVPRFPRIVGFRDSEDMS
jgi:ATP-dependent DNA ligase